MAGHGSKEDFIGGTTYLMTFPERGLVVAVMANISFADTKSIALNIAQAFAEQGQLGRASNCTARGDLHAFHQFAQFVLFVLGQRGLKHPTFAGKRLEPFKNLVGG